MLVAKERDGEAYAEWLDSFYARDIQELFHVEKRAAFLRVCELLMRQSGGLFEATSLARSAGISRPTVLSWLDVLTTTHAVTVVRPHHGGATREIVAQPKVYAFDTGSSATRSVGIRSATTTSGSCGSMLSSRRCSRFLPPRCASGVTRIDTRSTSSSHARVARSTSSNASGARARSTRRTSCGSARPIRRDELRREPRRAPAITRTEGGLEVTHVGLGALRSALASAPA